MAQSIAQMTKDLTEALVHAGAVSPENMAATVQGIGRTLHTLKAREQATSTAPHADTADWRKSIRKHTITCLECGETYRNLSIKHLAKHDLNTQEYRRKHGIPTHIGLSSKQSSQLRREVTRANRPWEKTPRWIEAHAEPKRGRGRPRKQGRA